MVQPGTYVMGSPDNEPCSDSGETQHTVTLTHRFEVTATEVTQAQFQWVMGYNPSYFTACGPTCPAENLTWHEAAALCNALSASKGLGPCYQCTGSGPPVTCLEAPGWSGAAVYYCPGYRLPTEGEWEYVARAGSTTAFCSGPNDPAQCQTCATVDPNLDAIGWYCANASSSTHPAAQKQANAWGIYDTEGNVWEWINDWWQGDLGLAAVTDPSGPSSGAADRVMRGGAWTNFSDNARIADRGRNQPTARYNFLGLRLVRTR
jgi:formylglycine-generating enzyme required for sulfatase activity